MSQEVKLTAVLDQIKKDPQLQAIEDRKAKYIEALGTLYVTIEEWLKEEVGSNEVTFQRIEEHLEEPYLPAYKVNRLEITFHSGNELVVLFPMGALSMAYNGKVEMSSRFNRVFLLLTDLKNQWVIEHPGSDTQIELNQTTFNQCMVSLLTP